jgi:quercetin dioxygenase-like cupin family protein
MTTDKDGLDLEDHVLRFRDLPGSESSYRPIDMLLSRFERDRYSVIGRPAEQSGPSTPLDEVEAFNGTYLRCAPGKGIGTHAHATPEVFIVMSGTWSVTLGVEDAQETILEPWDIIAVPPNAMHGAVNISDEDGWMMTINAGHGGAKLFWAPDLVEEIRSTGVEVDDTEIPGGGQ